VDPGQLVFYPTRDISFRRLAYDDLGRKAMATASAYEVSFSMSGDVGNEPLRLETQLMVSLKERLSRFPTCIDDVSIMMVIALISRDCETCIEHADDSRLLVLQRHIQGLRQMILWRGGFKILALNPDVAFHLHL
jgi:hypothetical protein